MELLLIPFDQLRYALNLRARRMQFRCLPVLQPTYRAPLYVGVFLDRGRVGLWGLMRKPHAIFDLGLNSIMDGR